MQILTGTVDVINGSPLVTGNDTSWATVVPGDVFIVLNDNVSYSIAAIRNPTLNVSGKWELDLTVPYAGVTLTGNNYAICQDFSPIYQFLLINRGDLRTDLIDKQNMLIVESLIAELAAGGVRWRFVDVVIAGALIGADTIPVTFPVALPTRPQFIQKPIFEKLDPMEDNVEASTIDSVTRFGFNVNLNSGAVAGHILHCAYVP